MPPSSSSNRPTRPKEIHQYGALRRPEPTDENYKLYLQRVGARPRWETKRHRPDSFEDYTWNPATKLYKRKERPDSVDSDHSDVDYLFDPDDDKVNTLTASSLSDSDDEEDEYMPNAGIMDSLWIYSNHLRTVKAGFDDIDEPAIHKHLKHLHRHLDWLIGHNVPPRAGLKEMYILCAGYNRLYQHVVSRQGNTGLQLSTRGTTPDTWLRILHRQPKLDSPNITKIASMHMPPHLILAMHGLPTQTLHGVLSHLVALAQSRRTEDREQAPFRTTTEPELLNKIIQREVKNELRRLLNYHNSKHSAEDPPHVMAAQDHTAARLCSLVQPTSMTATELHLNMDANNPDLVITDPPVKDLVLPGYMSPIIRQIPKEHMAIICEVARLPTNTRDSNQDETGDTLPQAYQPLDPLTDARTIICRIQELAHRHLIRQRLNKVPEATSNVGRAGIGSSSSTLTPAAPTQEEMDAQYICPQCAVPREVRGTPSKPPPCLICRSCDPPIPRADASAHTDWHTAHGTWRYYVPPLTSTRALQGGTHSQVEEDNTPYYIYIPKGRPPLSREETDAFISRISIQAHFNHTTSTVPEHQPLVTDSSSTTSWADLGIRPSRDPQFNSTQSSLGKPYKRRDQTTREFHPTLHVLHEMQRAYINATDDEPEPAFEKSDYVPRQLEHLLDSTNTTTRTWAQLLIKHTQHQEPYTKIAKRVRDANAREYHPPLSKRSRFSTLLDYDSIEPDHQVDHQARPTTFVGHDSTLARKLDIGAQYRLEGRPATTHPHNIDDIPQHLRRVNIETGTYGFPMTIDSQPIDSEAKAVDLIVKMIRRRKGEVRITSAWWVPMHRRIRPEDITPKFLTGSHTIDDLNYVTSPAGTYIQAYYCPDYHGYHTHFGTDEHGNGYFRAAHGWTLSTWLSDMGGNMTIKDLLRKWEAMPPYIPYQRTTNSPARDLQKRHNMNRSNMNMHLEQHHLMPHNRYLRDVAYGHLKEFMVHDLYLRDLIDTKGINLQDLPDLQQLVRTPDGTKVVVKEDKNTARFRQEFDESWAVQLCTLPLHHRRLLYPTLTTAQLSDPTIWVPAEHYFRCPRIFWGFHEGVEYTLPCGQVKRNCSSWIHLYNESARGPRNIWNCDCCLMAWGRQHKGTRQTNLRSPYHTIQYITCEPTKRVENAKIEHMITYYRKITGLQPRRDIEHYNDEPHKTTRFDITDQQDLVDLLYTAPNTDQLANWLYQMVVNSRADAETTSTRTD